MKYTTTAFATAGMVAMASAHGLVTKPHARLAGSAMQAACGQQVYDNQGADNYGNIQGELQIAASQTDYKADACDIWLCKGYKYADNTANVQKYTAGQVVPITVDIRAPHTGYANVSIVKTSTNTMIGSLLKKWDVYASTAVSLPADEEQFSITMPDVGSECANAGDCVIQWYWNAPSINQTYESCIDFTMAGSGSPGGASSSAASTTVSPVATSTSAAYSISHSASSTTSCTTKVTIHPSGTGMPDQAHHRTRTHAPSIISSCIANLTSVLPTNAQPTGSVPIPLPTPYPAKGTGVPTPKAPPNGVTLEQILEWIAYLLSTASNNDTADTVGKRSHPRDLSLP